MNTPMTENCICKLTSEGSYATDFVTNKFNLEITITILTMNSRNDQETSMTENFQVHI